MRLDTEAVELEIPKQPGLDFDVNLNLQGDELHLNAGTGFWLEWFPWAACCPVDTGSWSSAAEVRF